MAILTDDNSHWLEYDGFTVTIDGIKHLIRARSGRAIYPYPHNDIHVTAEQVDKTTKSYQDVKRYLGDDWLLDVFQIEGCQDIENQCKAQLAQQGVK